MLTTTTILIQPRYFLELIIASLFTVAHVACSPKVLGMRDPLITYILILKQSPPIWVLIGLALALDQAA